MQRSLIDNISIERRKVFLMVIRTTSQVSQYYKTVWLFHLWQPANWNCGYKHDVNMNAPGKNLTSNLFNQNRQTTTLTAATLTSPAVQYWIPVIRLHVYESQIFK